MPHVHALHPNVTADHVGFIPTFLADDDPRPAREQFHENYGFGGGWRSMQGFVMSKHGYCLEYPGDPPLEPLAVIPFRQEMILIYPHAWVAIVQKDGSFDVARMD